MTIDIIDIRETYKIADLGARGAAIDQIKSGRSGYAMVNIRRKGQICYHSSGILVPARLKGLTAAVLDEIVALIGTDPVGEYDAGGEIQGVTVHLDVTKGDWIEYQPAHRIYRLYRGRMPVWESVAGKVCDDPDALADCLC